MPRRGEKQAFSRRDHEIDLSGSMQHRASNTHHEGNSLRKGRSVPMEKLDRLVTGHLMGRPFKPERLSVLLSSLSARRAERAERPNSRLRGLQKEMAAADEKLARLYSLVEDLLEWTILAGQSGDGSRFADEHQVARRSEYNCEHLCYLTYRCKFEGSFTVRMAAGLGARSASPKIEELMLVAA